MAGPRLFAEFGFGNPTIRSTEIEWNDGHEVRVSSFIVSPYDRRCYLRIWIGYFLFVIDEDGFSVRLKDRRGLKILLGVSSSSREAYDRS